MLRNLVLAAAFAVAAVTALAAPTAARAEYRPGPPQIELVPVAFHWEYSTVFVTQARSFVVFETLYDDDGRPFTVPKTITRWVRVPVTTRIKVYDH